MKQNFGNFIKNGINLNFPVHYYKIFIIVVNFYSCLKDLKDTFQVLLYPTPQMEKLYPYDVHLNKFASNCFRYASVTQSWRRYARIIPLFKDSLLFHSIPFRSVPFHSIPFYSIQCSSIDFYSFNCWQRKFLAKVIEICIKHQFVVDLKWWQILENFQFVEK